MILCQLPSATVKYFKKGQHGSIRIGHKTGEPRASPASPLPTALGMVITYLLNKGLVILRIMGTLHTLPEPPSVDGGKKRGAGSDGKPLPTTYI